jgi:hypothetical protein
MRSIQFDLGATRHDLAQDEATFLVALLGTERSLAAAMLQRSVREAGAADSPRAIRLGLDDIAALRAVLCREAFDGFSGLESLKAFLCREGDGTP